MKTVYGPVPSWRLGRSLGVDPVCINVCSFDCVYCQLGPTRLKTTERKRFVDAAVVGEELESAFARAAPDIVTFSGMGEPTLASNIDKIAAVVKHVISVPMAILTNSSLLYLPEVRESLMYFDVIHAKLDAPGQELFEEINRPVAGIRFEEIVDGIKAMRNEFRGEFDLQMMFIDKNKDCAGDMAELARQIKPNDIFLDTPLRPCGCKPLGRAEMDRIKTEFAGLNTVMVYDAKSQDAVPLDLQETRKRRPEL
ncbi:MAG: radical SAM protein [Candidatus Diapherotrites archaeon]|nr:radical SAM protein [Candidatus Diapherotrites archaeon]